MAFGHCDIPGRVVDVEDDQPGDIVLTTTEAIERGIAVRSHPDPTLVNTRPTVKCIWEQRQKAKITDARLYILDQLGFGDGEDEVVDEAEDEEDEDDHPSRRRTHPFLDAMCAVEREDRRKMQRLMDYDSD